jgi:hypothetical protein
MTDPRPEPWHEADEKPAVDKPKKGGAPIGTHSLTGGGANVGMPPKKSEAERVDTLLDESSGEQPDPLAEPRAPHGGLLGPRR